MILILKIVVVMPTCQFQQTVISMVYAHVKKLMVDPNVPNVHLVLLDSPAVMQQKLVK